ncbi:MAG: hemolysin III family protein [Gracilibacteraceae bacterium]|jgi:hemolysin III|nr:hemolysin III family protein [Gracilibacteraceae bacterium]
MTNIERFNNQSLPEEIFNSVAHGLGVISATGGTAVLIVFACWSRAAVNIVSSAVYGFTLVFLFAMSTLYHAFTNRRVKKVFQVLDHCSIFLLILGTYTPICLSLIGGRTGWLLWGFNAALTVAGITANAVNLRRWHRLSLVLYLFMGWSVVVAIKPIMALLSGGAFYWLLGGGLCYSVGVLFYVAKKPRFMHAIWHIFVLAGAVLHYFFTLFYVIMPKAI